jgi:DNA polymerase III epsilon subunit family exonuclease
MLDQLISEIPLVFLDTETTGLNPRYGDRVVEIALARFRGGVMENYFVSLVNPGRSISPGASRIHGITDLDVRNAPTFADLTSQLDAEFGDAVLVAHNAPFDLGFLASEYRFARQRFSPELVVDTLSLLRRHFSFPSNSLPKVAHRLGIQTERFHRALADVLTTQAVFTFIAQELAAQGARTLGDFLELQGGTIQTPERNGADVPLPPALEEALRLNRKLFLHYVDGFGEHSERWVSPMGVHMQKDYLYLRAYCHLRLSERQFRLDRVIEMKVEE